MITNGPGGSPATFSPATTGEKVALAAVSRAARKDRGGDPAAPLVRGGQSQAERRAARRARAKERRAAMTSRDRARFAALKARLVSGELRGEEFRSEWIAAGGSVERIPARPYKARKGAVRRPSQTVLPAHLLPAPKSAASEKLPRGETLSEFERAAVESAILTAAAAIVPPGVAVKVSLGTRSRNALAKGESVRLWLTGGAFVDAGYIPPVVDPQHPRPAWYPSPDGWGGVRVMTAPGGGGRKVKVLPLLPNGSAGRLAARIRESAPDSIGRAVSVSLVNAQ